MANNSRARRESEGSGALSPEQQLFEADMSFGIQHGRRSGGGGSRNKWKSPYGVIKTSQQTDVEVRHPELKLNMPPSLFCMGWCPDFEFRGIQGLAAVRREAHQSIIGL